MNSILRRRRGMMGTTAGGNLPSAYQQVEWIESNNGPLIDTGIYGKLSTKIECGIQRTGTGDAMYPTLFGCHTPSILMSVQNAGSGSYWTFGNSGEKSVPYSFYNSIHDIIFDKTSITVDGSVKASYSATTLVEDSSVHIGIFGRFKGGSPVTLSAQCQARCSYFKIYENNTLVCDLIPCYRKSDNEIGMYDLVRQVFLTNANTGTFTKGADV